MDGSALGLLLRFLRDNRGLSLRELGRLAEVDHAYIHRLETGDKEAPSDDVLAKLIKVLKPGKRDAEMAQHLANYATIPSSIVAEVVKDPTITFEEFIGLATMAHRGNRATFDVNLQRVRRFLAEEPGDG